MNFIAFFLITCLCLVGAGCQTTDPKITSQERESMLAELNREHVVRSYENLLRINGIGYRLLAALPESVSEGKFAKLPFLIAEYPNAPGHIGILGIFSGLKPQGALFAQGDEILECDGEKVISEQQIASILKRISGDREIAFRFQRGTNQWIENVPILYMRRNLEFNVESEISGINAYADAFGQIVVTPEMLRFIDSDDELAFILAHEIAHVIKKHHVKTVANKLTGITAGYVLGTVTDKFAPGAGGSIGAYSSAIVSAPYSKEMEREADEEGLKYMQHAGFDLEAAVKVWRRFVIEIPDSTRASILATHPTSSNRLSALKEEITAMKQGALAS